MGIISRFADIMKANINDLLDKAEDPAKMVEQYLRDMKENLAEVKTETAGVLAEEKRTARILNEAKEDVDKWDGYARKAVAAGNDDDAKEFLAKKSKALERYNDAKNLHDVAKANADKMRQMHDKLASDIDELEARKDAIKAKSAVAATQEKMNQMTSGKSAKNIEGKFEDLESRIDRRLDSAFAQAELNEEPKDSADALADKYDNGSDIDAELAALKAEMGK